MRISIVQQDIVAGDRAATLRQTERRLLGAAPADMFVLPEMFATGFGAAGPESAEAADGEIRRWMERMADRLNAAVAGSVAVSRGSRLRNCLYFARPGGETSHYDKRHLFSFAGEQKLYDAGGRRVIAEYKGVRFLLQVCYDLRFPVWSRNRGDYDAAIYAASWPSSRIAVWDTLLRARAIENQCYVIGANRVGDDPSGARYPGRSAIIDCYGNTVAACADDKEEVASADLDMEALERFRKKFPVLNDADMFYFL